MPDDAMYGPSLFHPPKSTKFARIRTFFIRAIHLRQFDFLKSIIWLTNQVSNSPDGSRPGSFRQ